MFDNKRFLNHEGRPCVPEEMIMIEIDNNILVDQRSTPLIAALKNPDLVLDKDIVDFMDYLKENKICEFYIIESLKDLPVALAHRPQCFLFADDSHTIARNGMSEFMMMLKTLIHFTSPDSDIKIGYLLSKSTPQSYIKELQKMGVNALIPGMMWWPKEETIKGLEALTNGIPYWPKHLIDTLPGKVAKPRREAVHLTHRQQEVLELIANRGLSNKQIARTLGISESTVKIHVSAIMKAYCVRNRTQLALTRK